VGALALGVLGGGFAQGWVGLMSGGSAFAFASYVLEGGPAFAFASYVLEGGPS
jgi:hypothetical protein